MTDDLRQYPDKPSIRKIERGIIEFRAKISEAVITKDGESFERIFNDGFLDT